MLRPLSVGIRLVLLVLVTAVPLIGYAIGLVIRHAQAQREILLEQASQTTAAAMQSVDRELSGVITGLEVLAAAPTLQREDFQGFHSLASAAVGIAGNSVIILYERSGRRILSTAVPYGETLPIRKDMSPLDAPFNTGRPHVSPLFMSETVRVPTIGVTVPVKIRGEVRYVLGAGLLSDALTGVLRRSGVPSQWIAALVDQYGTIVARTVDSERTVGKKARPENWLHIQKAMSSTGTFDGMTQEGAPVTVTFSRSNNSGWTTLIAIPHALLESKSGRGNFVLIATTATILIAALIVAWLSARSISNAIRALIAPALALGSGQAVSTSRTNLHEVNRVAEALLSASNMLQTARHAAAHDVLTGLGNRILFQDVLTHHVELGRRSQKPFSVLYIDLDGFKQVNDSYGHATGDKLLRLVAERLHDCMRASDVIARVGGDEFAAILGETSGRGAEKVAADVISRMSAPYDIDGVRLTKLSASIGIASFPEAGSHGSEILARADQALYQAKGNGKGQYCVA